MSNFLNGNGSYIEDVKAIADLPLDWAQLHGRKVLISGATGMIGRFLIDTLQYQNYHYDLQCSIIAIGRSAEKGKERFSEHWNSPFFQFLVGDVVNDTIAIDGEVDYIFHLASNTHPRAYSTDPIGTITANVIGTNRLLEFASNHGTERFLFASSVEIYGENRGDVQNFDEEYCGYIDCNTLRAGYPESKRAGEALCQAYIKQKGMNIVIPRISRTYGPTMLMNDSKAISQFIKNGLAGKDIILKSEGNQFYSYCYVADTVSGLLYSLLYGKNGEAYNIADERSNISLKNLATCIANYVGTRVDFDLPDEEERRGYSTATIATMESVKIKELGWNAIYTIQTGIERTIGILRDCSK